METRAHKYLRIPMSNSMVMFCFKQKTAYEMRISDWSSDVCSSDLRDGPRCSRADLAHNPGNGPAHPSADRNGARLCAYRGLARRRGGASIGANGPASSTYAREPFRCLAVRRRSGTCHSTHVANSEERRFRERVCKSV